MQTVPPSELSLQATGLTKIVPPPDRHWADPFPLERGGRYYIFCENYAYAEKKALISVFEIAPNLPPQGPVTVLDATYHLSYPFLFEWRGETFLMPETAAAGHLEVYRPRHFPEDWELEATPEIETPLTDPTLVEVEGKWWMFANAPTEPDGLWDRDLHVFHSPSPLGPWTPHARNPVKSDLANARPAGRLFRHRGQLYRPAQDSSHGYGHAVVINRVVRLSAFDYEEHPVARLKPDWEKGLVGTHTINWSGDLLTIDGVVRRSKLNPARLFKRSRVPSGASVRFR